MSTTNETPIPAPDAWLRDVRAAERRGELLAAVDLAERGLAEHPGDIDLTHRLILALARAGATDEAARRFNASALDDIEGEEVAALGARIAKDRALARRGPARSQGAARAAERYGAIHQRSQGYYPAINAATMWLVAGRPAQARSLATEVLRLLERSGEESYYAAATEAEAQLLLNDTGAARQALNRAVIAIGDDYGALSTTRRQLRLVCELQGIDTSLLDVLAGPGVAHFCGHVIAAVGVAGRFRAEQEDPVAAAMVQAVEAQPIGFAYGALAAGADILWAEALLAAGAELHVVLPFDREEFIHTSVATAGAEWVRRFDACLSRAAEVTFATADAFLGDDVLFHYGTQLAMGMALSRSRFLDADVVQFALWDGEPARGAAGTASDVAGWRRGGRRTVVLGTRGESRPAPPPTRLEAVRGAATSGGGRVVRGLLFGDVKGFSKLTDEQLPRFAEHVLGAFARVIETHGSDIESANTWGDAVYLVVSDVVRAARCALDLQTAMAAIDLDAVRLPAHLALRLGAHIGPVFPIQDPVIGRMGFMGSHVSRTARIEPVTPPGEVYVTAAFAAAVALAQVSEVSCDYVGHLPAAKDYGLLRMYRLRSDAPSVD